MDLLIVDDHPLVISGCRAIFASDPTITITSASDEKTGFQKFLNTRPQVSIIDLNLPGLSGFELLRKVREVDPSAKTIMFSMNDDPAFILRSIELGANGYLSKSDDPRYLIEAVLTVASGGSFISPRLAKEVTFSSASIRANPLNELGAREIEILRLLARGNNIAEVADALELSYKTIANSTTSLRQKLGAKNHSDLIRKAVELDLQN